jgi:acid phosphatase family membrane protein YuiD
MPNTPMSTAVVEGMTPAAVGVLADNFGKFANAAFNGGCAVILGWLVVSEISAMRQSSAQQAMVITKALDEVLHEVKELRRERVGAIKSERPANN